MEPSSSQALGARRRTVSGGPVVTCSWERSQRRGSSTKPSPFAAPADPLRKVACVFALLAVVLATATIAEHSCDSDEYQVAAPTATSERVCSQYSTCDPNSKYIYVAGTPTSDVVCKAYDLDPYIDSSSNVRQYPIEQNNLVSHVPNIILRKVFTTYDDTHTAVCSVLLKKVHGAPLPPASVFLCSAFANNTVVVTWTHSGSLPGFSRLDLEVAVSDSRPRCVQKQQTYSGGCTARAVFNIFVAHLQCPVQAAGTKPIPTGDAKVYWQTPTVDYFNDGTSVISIVQSVSSGSGRTSYPVGTTQPVSVVVSPSRPSPQPLVCQFGSLLLYGLSAVPQSITHFFSPPFGAGEVLHDGGQMYGGNGRVHLKLELLDLTQPEFTIAIRAPDAEVFTLEPNGLYSPRFQFSMQWCSSGGMPPTHELLPIGIELLVVDLQAVGRTGAAIAPHNFTKDPSSGISADGRCLRLAGFTSPFVDNVQFAGLFIRVTQPHALSAAAALKPTLYAVQPSLFMTFSEVADGDVVLLSIDDSQPPTITNCPRDINMQITSGVVKARASWVEPTITDNVGVSSVTISHPQGQDFYIYNSPEQVVYTATDDNGLVSTCSFVVTTDYLEEATRTLELEIGLDDFQPSMPMVSAFGVSAYADEIISPGSRRLDFTGDLELHDALRVVLRPPPGERFEIAFRGEDVQARLEVDLAWRRSGMTANYDRLASTPAKIVVAFENLQLTDTEPVITHYPPWFTTLAGTQLKLSSFGNEIVRMHGVSAFFSGGATFTGLNITLQYPEGVDAVSMPLRLENSSFVRFAYHYLDSPGVAVEDLIDDRTNFFSLEDPVSPTFNGTCPENIAIVLEQLGEVGPGEMGEVVNGSVFVTWTEPVATDNRKVHAVHASHRPNEYYPITNETLWVTYTASDAVGNTALCTFSIDTTDPFPPSLECASRIEVQTSAGLATGQINEADYAINATDNTGLPVVVTTALQTEFPIGLSIVTVVVADGMGNQANCSVEVMVIDAEVPVFSSCPESGSIVVVASAGSSTAAATWQPILAMDNSGEVELNGTHSSGAEFPVGDTAVVYTATDGSGNRANCTFVVTVLDLARSSAGASGGASAGVIAGAVMAVLVLLVILGVALFRRTKMQSKQMNFDELMAQLESIPGVLEGSDGRAVRPREIRRGGIRLLSELGQGNFGAVYKGRLKEHAHMPAYLVAVKTLHGGLQRDRDELMREAAIMAQFHCEFIVGLVGVCTQGDPIMAIIEFMEHGSLQSYLARNSEEMDDERRLIIAGDCAEGLRYLAERSFVHRDIAARNILISSEHRAKIADFGMSRDTGNAAYYSARSNNQLPIRWTAPEALEHNKYSPASDCWSFGVLLYEIWTHGEMPYKGISNQRVWIEVLSGYRLPRPVLCPEVVYEMILRCWDAEPEQRVAIGEAATFFRGLVCEDEDEEEDGEAAGPRIPGTMELDRLTRRMSSDLLGGGARTSGGGNSGSCSTTRAAMHEYEEPTAPDEKLRSKTIKRRESEDLLSMKRREAEASVQRAVQRTSQSDKKGSMVRGRSNFTLERRDGNDSRSVSPAPMNAYASLLGADGVEIAPTDDIVVVMEAGSHNEGEDGEGDDNEGHWASGDGNETDGWSLMDAESIASLAGCIERHMSTSSRVSFEESLSKALACDLTSGEGANDGPGRGRDGGGDGAAACDMAGNVARKDFDGQIARTSGGGDGAGDTAVPLRSEAEGGSAGTGLETITESADELDCGNSSSESDDDEAAETGDGYLFLGKGGWKGTKQNQATDAPASSKPAASDEVVVVVVVDPADTEGPAGGGPGPESAQPKQMRRNAPPPPGPHSPPKTTPVDIESAEAQEVPAVVDGDGLDILGSDVGVQPLQRQQTAGYIELEERL